MVYESYPWKRDLLRRKNLILRYNTKNQIAKNEEAAYSVIEKGIFYSAFIIRKLIDCAGKTSDEVNRYQLTTEAVMPRKPIDVLHRWPTEESYDWAHKKASRLMGKMFAIG